MSKFYSSKGLRALQLQINIVMGIRGNGKSYRFKTEFIQDWMNSNLPYEERPQFIWMRRYKEQAKLGGTEFLTDLNGDGEFNEYYDDGWAFSSSGNFVYAHKGKKKYIMGYIGALSQSEKFKSVPFSNVKNVCYEEFLSSGQYLPNEFNLIAGIMSTVFRHRDGFMIMLANSISMDNPVFNALKITKLNSGFNKIYVDVKKKNVNGEIVNKRLLWGVVEYIDEHSVELLSDYEKNSISALFGSASDYNDYAFGAEFILDNSFLVERLKGDKHFKYCLKFEDLTIGVWTMKGTGYMYLSEKYNKSGKVYAVDKNSLDGNESGTIMNTNNLAAHLYNKILAKGVRFETQQIKNLIITYAQRYKR